MVSVTRRGRGGNYFAGPSTARSRWTSRDSVAISLRLNSLAPPVDEQAVADAQMAIEDMVARFG